MTFTPNLRRSGQLPLRVEKSSSGVFRVKNAYSGTFEYFKGRPLPKVAKVKANTSE